MARLGDVFPLIRNGASIKQTNGAGGLPITRIETIANREIDRSRMGYADVTDLVKYADYQLQDGDILMSHINSEKHLGKVARYKAIDGEYIIHGMNLLMLRADKSLITPGYAECFFNSDMFLRQIPNITKKSVNQASFNVSALKELQIPIATLATQHEIEMRFEKVDSLISLRKQQIAKLDELIKSRFIELFENKYNTIKIGDVFKTTSGGTPSKAHPEYYEGGTIPWLSSGEVNAGVISSVKNCITQAGVDNSSAKMVPENSVVIAMYGATAGQVGLLRIATTTNQAVCSVLPNNSYVPEYLYYAVKSKKDWMISQCAGGAQPNISQGIIRKMEIIDAPLEKQEQFATFVEQTDKSKLTIQKSLDQLELLKKALMQKYFG